MNGVDMIFPQLRKEAKPRQDFEQTAVIAPAVITQTETHSEKTRIAARPRQPEPIDWWARDAWEFYAIVLFMICWMVFWYGVHTGQY